MFVVSRNARGFTLIELVMVIIVVAILSVFALSRSSDGQGYLDNIVRNQLIAGGRQAQLTAMSRASDTNTLTWQVTGLADEWHFQVINQNVACNTDDACYSRADRGEEVIRYGTDLAADCNTLTSVVDSSLTVVFDGDGNLTSAANMRICIDSNVDRELCISPSGYVYEGTCQI